MTIEQMTPEEEVRLRLAAGISPSTPTEYMLRHIPLWVKRSILRRNTGVVIGGGGDTPTKRITTYDFTTNTYRKDGSKASLGDVSEFIRLSSATMWQDRNLVEVTKSIPRISGEGLLIEPQSTNLADNSEDIEFFGNNPRGVRLAEYVSEFGVTLGHYEINSSTAQTGYSQWSGGPIVPAGRNVLSFIAKAGTHTEISVWAVVVGSITVIIDLSLGTVTAGDAVVTPLPNGWFHIAYTFEMPNEGTPNFRIRLGQHLEDGVDFYLGAVQLEGGDEATSYISTHGTPATRTPDILNIPLLPSQTISGDWDEGVTHSLGGGIVTFTGHGRIRTITVEEL